MRSLQCRDRKRDDSRNKESVETVKKGKEFGKRRFKSVK